MEYIHCKVFMLMMQKKHLNIPWCKMVNSCKLLSMIRYGKIHNSKEAVVSKNYNRQSGQNIEWHFRKNSPQTICWKFEFHLFDLMSFNSEIVWTKWNTNLVTICTVSGRTVTSMAELKMFYQLIWTKWL